MSEHWSTGSENTIPDYISPLHSIRGNRESRLSNIRFALAGERVISRSKPERVEPLED
jgi:hypothetical protein